MSCRLLAGAVEVRKELADRTELDIPATLLFDYPSPAELAAFILSSMPPPAVKTIPTAPLIPVPVLSQPLAAAAAAAGALNWAQGANAGAVAAESAHPVWWHMPASERFAWAADVVRDVVVKILEKDLDDAQPLMMAGLDSLGAFELAHGLLLACKLHSSMMHVHCKAPRHCLLHLSMPNFRCILPAALQASCM